MRNTSASEGVCPACRFGPDCIYATTGHRPILQCEQFELALPAASSRQASPVARTAAGEYGGHRLAGLCSNCEFRDACIYPEPEGGVWRCEEYR